MDLIKRIMERGIVKWYNEAKGFGFIKLENGDEIFVHRSGLYTPYGGLQNGQTVELQIRQGERGLVATDVK